MDHRLGVQSFTYRTFDLDGICRELDGSAVESIELCGVHVDPGADDETVASVRSRLADVGVDVCGFGVHDFDAPDEVRDVFAFADELGAEYVSVNFPAERDDVADELAVAAEEFDLLVGIHNHGPGAEYDTVEDVLDVVEGRHERLGACVDTGHFLRSGQSPADVIPPLGDRVHAVHLKDFVGGETEVVPGDGDLDIAETLSLLAEHTSFDQPLVVEYEEDADDPTPALRTVADRLRDV
jgi:sugar phosphate isomerase/epimerase